MENKKKPMEQVIQWVRPHDPHLWNGEMLIKVVTLIKMVWGLDIIHDEPGMAAGVVPVLQKRCFPPFPVCLVGTESGTQRLFGFWRLLDFVFYCCTFLSGFPVFEDSWVNLFQPFLLSVSSSLPFMIKFCLETLFQSALKLVLCWGCCYHSLDVPLTGWAAPQPPVMASVS